MIKFLCLVLVILGLNTLESNSAQILPVLQDYFQHDTVKSLKSSWLKYKKSYERAVGQALKDGYGDHTVNLHLEHHPQFMSLSKGFCLTDNVLKLHLFNVTMRSLPKLIMPKVSLDIGSNLVKVEATADKIFVDSLYYAARNESAVLFSSKIQDTAKESPFSLQQVQPTGNLTIIAEDCSVNGFSISSLAGQSVTIGHSTYRLCDCKFSVEISDSDSGAPPVISPYFPKNSAKQLEKLMSWPIRGELVPKLQAALYSFVNTSNTFGKDLPTFRLQQQKLFKKTSGYITGLCQKLNKLTLKENKGNIKLPTLSEIVQSKTDVAKSTLRFTLNNMTLYGLDTAYAARVGGSFDIPTHSVADAIKFASLQIRGTVNYDYDGSKSSNNFAAQLEDAVVHVVADVAKSEHKFDFAGWRSLSFSILPWELPPKMRVWYESLVHGHIINEVPPQIIKHLSSVMTPAASDNGGEKPLNDDIPSDANSGEKTDEVEPESDGKEVPESNPNPSKETSPENDGNDDGGSAAEEPGWSKPDNPGNDDEAPDETLNDNSNKNEDWFDFNPDNQNQVYITINGKKQQIVSSNTIEKAPDGDNPNLGSDNLAAPATDDGNLDTLSKTHDYIADSPDPGPEKPEVPIMDDDEPEAQPKTPDDVADDGDPPEGTANQSKDDTKLKNMWAFASAENQTFVSSETNTNVPPEITVSNIFGDTGVGSAENVNKDTNVPPENTVANIFGDTGVGSAENVNKDTNVPPENTVANIFGDTGVGSAENVNKDTKRYSNIGKRNFPTKISSVKKKRRVNFANAKKATVVKDHAVAHRGHHRRESLNGSNMLHLSDNEIR